MSGKTLLVWRSVWDSPADAQEFLSAAQSRLGSAHAAEGSRRGFRVFASPPWRFAIGERAAGVDFVSSDDPRAFEAALTALGGS